MHLLQGIVMPISISSKAISEVTDVTKKKAAISNSFTSIALRTVPA